MNPKKLLFLFLPLLILLITVQVANHKTSYKSKAEETQTTPVIIPGSLLDTGIKAETFTDVDHLSWSWKYIQQIAPLDIIVPPPATPEQFNPSGNVSRMDMAEFLLKTYKLLTKKDAEVVPTPFTDITSLAQEKQDIVAKIYGLKITAGTSATTFSPNDPVNRAQMVTFFMNLYQAITGTEPPQSDVPFTDINDPDLAWAAKRIRMAYNLKITAGTSNTTFSPRDNVTREQMAAFIFNFMRLFGAGWNKAGLAEELAGIRGVTYISYLEPPTYDNLKKSLPDIQTTGFNAVWLVSGWKDFNPKPLTNPPVYNEAKFTELTKILDLLRQNNMKAILPLNYVGPAPEGVDACRWTVDLTMYQAFENYVREFLKRIEPYSDMVYVLFFSEGAEPCGLNRWDPKDGQLITSLLRPTLGSLPQRLDPALRQKFKIGYHEDTGLSSGLSASEASVQLPLSYDFYSFALYGQEEKSDEEIRQVINDRVENIKKLFPFTPIIVGEFGAFPCNNNSSRENQARVLTTGIQQFLTQKLGFNIWQWRGLYYKNGDACGTDPAHPSYSNPDGLGIIYVDQPEPSLTPILVSKPARLEIMKLLSPTNPLPSCVEQDAPVFGYSTQNNSPYCYRFHSTCLSEGASATAQCSAVCRKGTGGAEVWVRNPQIWDGLCSERNPFPGDCIPLNEGGPEHQYVIDDSCRPRTSPSPSPTSVLSPPETITTTLSPSLNPSSPTQPPTETPATLVIGTLHLEITPPSNSPPPTITITPGESQTAEINQPSQPGVTTNPPTTLDKILGSIVGTYNSFLEFVSNLVSK